MRLIHRTTCRHGALEGSGLSVQDEIPGTVTSGGGNLEAGVLMLRFGLGDQSAVIPADQRGLPRQVDAVAGGIKVDVGAVELQADEFSP